MQHHDRIMNLLAAQSLCHRQGVQPLPWYPQKMVPSFADALAWLRRDLWRARFIAGALQNPAPANNPDEWELLIDQVARAA
jgi:hypothetical protein